MDNATRDNLTKALEDRFIANMARHKTIAWSAVHQKLLANPSKLEALSEMESSGGEPDVVGFDQHARVYIFCDCSPESPAGRRSLCFDRAALDARKENKPKGSAVELAGAMSVAILDEQQYRDLQTLGEFDRKTSSWIATPTSIRARGGALFCDRRYDHVFVYHNGADSYYAARGFRTRLEV